MAKIEKMLNGIPSEQLDQTIESIQKDKELAKFTLRAKNRWIEGAHSQTEIQGFYGAKKEDDSRSKPFTLYADEPSVLLGTDKGPNATEALLYALASCLNTTFIYHATADQVEIESLEIEIEGDLDLQGFLALNEEVRNGFQEIRVTFHVEADAPRQAIEELVQIAQDRSPVYDMIVNQVPISVNLT